MSKKYIIVRVLHRFQNNLQFILFRFQRYSMERMLRLAAALKYENLQTKTPADDSFKMTALLSVIKPTTLKVLVISLGYHSCYLVLRLLLRKDRPLAINAYYGFDTFSTPIYEMVNLSQVRSQTQNSSYKLLHYLVPPSSLFWRI